MRSKKDKIVDFVVGLVMTVLFLGGLYWIGRGPEIAQAQTQYHYPGMFSTQVTIGSGVTQFTTADTPVKGLCVQNNQTHSMRVGGSGVTSSIGILLQAGSPGGDMCFGPQSFGGGMNLQQFYVAGTQNDVLDVTYLQ